MSRGDVEKYSVRTLSDTVWIALRYAAIACIAALFVGSLGCDEQKFGEAERREVHRVLQTGIGFDADPYVQAETLRVLEIIGKPSLNHFAEELVGDEDSPMVRVAALRVLLANDYKDIRRVALTQVNNAEAAEKKAILEAVYDYGSPRLRRVLISRALTSEDPRLRREAFQRGPLERLRQAREQKKTMYLQNTLFPEIGQFVDDADPVVASMALRALVAAGQEDRANPLLETLQDTSEPRAKRLVAARILGGAQVEAAVPVFREILKSVRITDEGELLVPEKIDKKMVRAATLGLVACGETDLVHQAQIYLENAGVKESIEVLTALSTNPSKDAAISLKVAMEDARAQVRDRAIELYSRHKFANAADLIEVMGRSDFDTKKRLAQILAEDYPEDWAIGLSAKLAEPKSSLETLEFLRGVILSEDQNDVLRHLEPQLSNLAFGGKEKISALAALLLVKVSDDPKTHAMLAAVEDPTTRYAYLEYLVRTAPRKNVDYFRKNLYGDLYAIRLMSAAGLLLAFDAGAPPAAKPEGASAAVAVSE
jgi:HEAT repeat protein